MIEVKGYKLVAVELLQSLLDDPALVVRMSSDKIVAIKEALDSSAQPQPIYDEAKERELFEQGYYHSALIRDGDEYIRMSVQLAWEGWENCAQSRAKAGAC